jgi:hypothetical protein
MPGTTINATRDHVASLLADLVGRVELEAGGRMSFPWESTRVFVDVHEWGEASSVVQLTAINNVDVPLSPELYEFVARHTNDWVFGHLGMWISDDGTAMVHFSHALLADFLDPEELQAAVAAVAFTGAEIDDQILERFGGRLLTAD